MWIENSHSAVSNFILAGHNQGEGREGWVSYSHYTHACNGILAYMDLSLVTNQRV